MKKADILNILRTNKTVFSFKDIFLASSEKNPNLLKRRINYYIKQGELYPIRRGIYAKDKNYNKLELATKIYTPSYISLETVLAQAGAIFQYYSQVFTISYLSRDIKIDKQTYSYRKIKDSILTNSTGIIIKDNYFIAIPERAFLDIIYLNKQYYFDNLRAFDWGKIFEILPIYKSKKMETTVKQYFKEYKDNK